MADMRRYCGNSPDAELTDGDRQAIDAAREYFARRRADERLRELIATSVARPLTVPEAHQLREAIEALAAERDRLRAERDQFADRIDTLAAVAKSNQRAHRILAEECANQERALGVVNARLDAARAQVAAARAFADELANSHMPRTITAAIAQGLHDRLNAADAPSTSS